MGGLQGLRRQDPRGGSVHENPSGAEAQRRAGIEFLSSFSALGSGGKNMTRSWGARYLIAAVVFVGFLSSFLVVPQCFGQSASDDPSKTQATTNDRPAWGHPVLFVGTEHAS